MRTKLHVMMTHILMSCFKKSTERRSFLKETVQNADLHEAVLSKTMITQEQSVKYDFVAPLTKLTFETNNYLFKRWNNQMFY